MKRGIAGLFGKRVLRNALIVVAIAFVAYVVMYGVREGFQAGRPTRSATPPPPKVTPPERKLTLIKNPDGYYYVNLTKTDDKQVIIPKSDFTPGFRMKKISFEYWGPARGKTVESFMGYDTAIANDKYTYLFPNQNVPPNVPFKMTNQGVLVQIGDPLAPSHIRVNNPEAANVEVNNDIFISRLTATNMNILKVAEKQKETDAHIRIKIE